VEWRLFLELEMLPGIMSRKRSMGILLSDISWGISANPHDNAF